MLCEVEVPPPVESGTSSFRPAAGDSARHDKLNLIVLHPALQPARRDR